MILLTFRSSRMSSVATMKKAVEQLKREMAVERVKVSITTRDLVEYTERYKAMDMLVTGKPHTGDNPYRPRSMCAVL